MLRLLISVCPVIVIVLFMYFRDRYEKEPIGFMLKVFLWGMIATIPIAIVEAMLSPFLLGLFGTIVGIGVVAGLVEEGGKYLVFKKFVYNNYNFNEPYDAILYAVLVSMGFAVIENVGYIFNADKYIYVGITRSLYSIPGHALFGVIMGHYFMLAKYKGNVKRNLKLAFIVPFLVHAGYDILVGMSGAVGMVYFVILSISMIWGIKKALMEIKADVEQSPFK